MNYARAHARRPRLFGRARCLRHVPRLELSHRDALAKAESSDVESAVRGCFTKDGWKLDDVGSYSGGANVVTGYKAKDQTDVYIYGADTKPRITGGPDDANPFWKCLGSELAGSGGAAERTANPKEEAHGQGRQGRKGQGRQGRRRRQGRRDVILARSQHEQQTLHAARARSAHHDGRRRKARRPRQPDHPLHRGRRHGPRHLGAPACASSTRRCRRPTAASARSPGSRSSPARRRSRQFNNWLPGRHGRGVQEYLVGIKGPLTTPVGGGIRSLNVALRQMLDLYVCLRPVR